MTDRIEQWRAARECEREALGVTAAGTESARAAASAKRLEDVEKVVRKLREELAEHQDFTLVMMDRLMTRLEALESIVSWDATVLRLERRVDHD